MVILCRPVPVCMICDLFLPTDSTVYFPGSCSIEKTFGTDNSFDQVLTKVIFLVDSSGRSAPVLQDVAIISYSLVPV